GWKHCGAQRRIPGLLPAHGHPAYPARHLEILTMEQKVTHYAETRYGFEYGAVSVERMFSHNGYVGIRLVCYASGEYVDVQVSPKGRKMHVMSGNDKRLTVSADGDRNE